MPSRKELLQSIHPDMKLNKAFFLKIYGYEMTWPGFSETALRALEDAGCSKSQSYYDAIVLEHEKTYRESLIEAAVWYGKTLDDKWERQVKENDKSVSSWHRFKGFPPI